MPEKIKLFLADDHQVLIDGLLAFFKDHPRYEVVGAANDGAALLATLPTLEPDVVLLDLNMPRVDGLASLERIVKEQPRVKVLVLSNYHQTEIVRAARDKGAWGYLLKNGSLDELLAALEAVTAGQPYWAAAAVMAPEPEFFADAFLKKYQLTRREADIIRMICGAYNSRTIADRLCISEFTVNTHRRNILRKLGVKNTAGVINFARQHHLC